MDLLMHSYHGLSAFDPAESQKWRYALIAWKSMKTSILWVSEGSFISSVLPLAEMKPFITSEKHASLSRAEKLHFPSSYLENLYLVSDMSQMSWITFSVAPRV